MRRAQFTLGLMSPERVTKRSISSSSVPLVEVTPSASRRANARSSGERFASVSGGLDEFMSSRT